MIEVTPPEMTIKVEGCCLDCRHLIKINGRHYCKAQKEYSSMPSRTICIYYDDLREKICLI